MNEFIAPEGDWNPTGEPGDHLRIDPRHQAEQWIPNPKEEEEAQRRIEEQRRREEKRKEEEQDQEQG